MKLTLKYPLNPFVITQRFGLNGDYYRAHGINVAGHNGLDLQAFHGQPVYASHDGTAYYTDDDGKEGDGVVIISKDKYEIDGVECYTKTVYWHLCDPHKEPGFASPVYLSKGKQMDVKTGDVIGYADNTGFSTGDHLHFGLKSVAFREVPFSWFNLKQDNGYAGAIDPFPYLETNTNVFNRDLTLGSIGDDVKYLQIRMGMPAKYQTAYFGLITKSYVAAYQLKNGIMPPFGYVGIKTRAALNMGV